MTQISVIVPVYNVEPYLSQCIDSILSQTFSNFELILVDDGSSDQSGKICDEYAARDSRIVVIHKENGGVSSARNAGLNIAKGEYITFIDSDDWISSDFFQQAINNCEKNNLDMYLAGFIRMMPDGKQYKSAIPTDITCYSDEIPQELFANLLNKNYTANSTAKLIRKQLIGMLRFDLSMNWGEDLKFIFSLLEQHVKLQATSKVVYYYRVGHASLTASTSIEKCNSMIQTYDILYHEITKRGYSYGKYQSFLDLRCYSDLLYMEQLICNSNDSICEKIRMLRALFQLSDQLPFIHDTAFIRHLHLYRRLPFFLLLRSWIEVLKKEITIGLHKLYRRINFEIRLLFKTHLSVEEATKIVCECHEQAKPSFNQKNIINKVYDLMIVIPIYNVQMYLEECLDSVFSQKTQYSYSIVAVDDGSTDASAVLLNHYEQHKNLTIIRQENKGPSEARNAALKNINASYVMFLDADDVLPADAIQKLLTAAFENNVDIVQGNYIEFDGKGLRKTITYSDNKCNISPINLSGFTGMKIFRAELFENFCFPAGFLFEDTVLSKLVYPKCQSAICIPDVVYYYRQHMQSFSRRPQTLDNLDTYWITKYCLEEAVRRGYYLNEEEFSDYLQQCWVNYIRTQELPYNVQESIFVLTGYLLQKYFSKKIVVSDKKLKLLQRSFRSNSYHAYDYILKRWNLI